MRRHAVGLLAVFLLILGVGLWLADAQQWLEFACLRVGALLAVWWVAYPDLRRLPAWLLVAAPVVLVLVALRPRRFLVLVPLLVAAALLWPRKRS